MYPNAQIRWASVPVGVPSGQIHDQELPANQEEHSSVIHTPAYRHLALAAFLFLSVLFGGTAEALKVVANQQVVYQPAAVSAAAVETNPSPAVTATAPQPPQVAPQPAVAPPAPDHSVKVQAVLDSWAAGHSSKQWGVVVQGLNGDQTKATLNASSSFKTASVYKLFLMYPLFQKYSLSTLDDTSLSVVGRGTQNLKTCVQQAIVNSDNPCGDAIGEKVGWSHPTAALRQIGMGGTNLNTSNLTTTAADTSLFLQKLNDGQLMTPDQQQFLLGLMQQQKYRSGIPKGCAGCTVADKVGFLSGVMNDAGIVKYSGGTYALTILTNGASWSQIAQLTSQIQAAMKS